MKEGVLRENNVIDFSGRYGKDRVCHYSAKNWTQNQNQGMRVITVKKQTAGGN